MRRLAQHRLQLVEGDTVHILPGAHQIERRVHRRAAQKTGHVLHRRRAGLALHQAQKDGLQHVFGVRRVSRYAVGGAEHQGIVLAENALPFRLGRIRPFPSGSHHGFHGSSLIR